MSLSAPVSEVQVRDPTSQGGWKSLLILAWRLALTLTVIIVIVIKH